MSRRMALRRIGLHLFLISSSLIMLYPLIWLVSSSIKPESLIFSDLSLWPRQITFAHYRQGWYGYGITFGRFLRNSLFVALLAVIGNVIACSMAAYAFARLRFHGKNMWFTIMLLTMMLPQHVTLLPQYLLFLNIGWINTYWPLIVPHFLAVDAFFIFLMGQFMRGIPRALDEAARIDGAGPFRTYLHIIMPLTVPALVPTSIFTFIWTWDDFFSQLIYLSSIPKYTVPLALRLFLDQSGQSAWGPLFAMSTLALIPAFGFFLAFQRLLVEGVGVIALEG